ncbi:hypothetical protein DIURU_003407 [Diutina rugosa]|uniref:E3 ubiquitin-protein ligase listerin n=1 Tax=Diutina rugosa TaxID=5481 RepID=A0A642UL17_DIURU|nr:uncharacterized protein DIURU_003407 [Diutina rugosa]KAA8901037.1 hypothetical protein DIURU_003407 [Diutina rugosa]
MSGDLGCNQFSVTLNYFSANPDLNNIHDANVVVVLKGLAKKDATTKERALSDLIELIDDMDSFDEPLMVSWIQSYAKLAFDNSRHVRIGAHTVMSSMVKKGGKAIAKYMKSFVALWLSGLFDSDRLVSRQSLQNLEDAFQGDVSKIEKLWHIFGDQISNFCNTVVNVESSDSMSDKRYTKPEDAKAKYQRVVHSALSMLEKLAFNSSVDIVDEVFRESQLWDTIEESLAVESLFNSSLFKSFMSLVKFTITDAKVSTSTYKTVAKSFVKSIKIKIKNTVLISQIIIQLWDLLVVASKSANHKRSFWEYAGSKSESRIIDWLKVGSCNSDPVYYSIVSRFFEIIYLKSPVPFDFDDAEVGNVIIKIFLKQLKKAMVAFLPRAISCTIKVGSLFKVDEAALNLIIYTAIDNIAKYPSIPPELELAKEALVGCGIPNDLVQTLKEQLVSEDAPRLILGGYQFDSSLYRVVKIVSTIYPDVDIIGDIEQRVIEGADASADLFDLISDSLRQKDRTINCEFVNFSPSFITPDFVKPLLDYFSALVECYPKVITRTLVNDYYLKLSMDSPENVTPFLISVTKVIDLHAEKAHYSDEYAFITKLATKQEPSAEELQLVYSYSDQDPSIRDAVMKTTEHSEKKLLAFIRSNPTAASKLSNLDRILHVSWSHIDDDSVKKFLDCVNHETKFASVIKYANTWPPNLSSVCSYIGDSEEWAQSFLTFIESESDVVKFEGVGISNSLGAGVELISPKGTHDHSDDVIALASLVGQIPSLPWYIKGLYHVYVQDYLFVKPVQVQQTRIVLESLSFANSQPLLKAIISDSHPLSVYLTRTSGFSYQCARVLVYNLLKEIDSMDNSSFNEFYSDDWSKFEPFKLATLLQASTKFFGSLTWLQNYLFSEMIGIGNESEILTSGLKWLTLALYFVDENASQLPLQRLNMIVRQMSRWLDSSIAYDVEFIPIRLQLTRLAMGFYSTQDAFHFKEVSMALVDDNLSICTTEPQLVALRFFSLKLMTMLGNEMDTEEVEDLLLSPDIQQFDRANYNQAVAMCHQAVERLYLVVDVKGKIEKYMELLAATNSVAIERVCAGVLVPAVLKKQRTFVIEFQLDKSEDKVAHLPQKLLDIIRLYRFDVNIEDESATLTRYVWAWVILFAYFADITFALRQEYLKQLRLENVIEPMLSYIFDQVYDLSVLKSSVFSLDRLRDYDCVDAGRAGNLQEEMAFALLHLYYQSCAQFGPQVQQWYMSIRDLQVKKRVEKVTSSYVAPELLGAILDEVTKQKIKLENDDNLKIKVNRVIHEIRSTYVIDEQTMEMIIKLPAIYPLEKVVVEGPLRLGVREKQWKAWLMATQSVISLTNGSITEAIEVFNRNVTLHFSGFEDCAICYSILHQDLSLPTKSCPTCNNKFHAACLYKWFKSSGSSTCPMCRGQFNFRKQASA